MRTLTIFAVASLLLVYTPQLIAQPKPITGNRDAETTPRLASSMVGPALFFEPNVGQASSDTRFLLRGPSGAILLQPGQIVWVSSNSAEGEWSAEELRLRFVDSNLAGSITGVEELGGKSNYFLGSEPQQWLEHVPHYARVVYHDVYPKVDVEFYGKGRDLEYDFVVRPGGDPADITLALGGATRQSVTGHGELVLESDAGVLRHPRPLIYQMVEGQRRTIQGGYVLDQHDGRITFRVAKYDPALPLVIDPVFVFSTYIGGNSSENGLHIAADSTGASYVAGTTSSLDFPSEVPFSPGRARGDIFVLKLDSSGSNVQYATYFGGFGFDFVNGIAVDESGNAYLAGSTYSFDFPTRSAFQNQFGGGDTDGWIAKLDSGGAIVYSTFLGVGGGASSGVDSIQGLAVDAQGSAYVIGTTGSTAFPTRNPVQPGCGGYLKPFVAKFSPDASSLVYSSCLKGGMGGAIAVDAQGSAYLAGPNLDGNMQPMITKLNSRGSAVLYSTNPAGSAIVSLQAIAVDGVGNAIVAGMTGAPDVAVVSPFQRTLTGASDAFIAKLSSAGTVAYASYFGGSGTEMSRAVATDAAGNIYVAGLTGSTDLPVANALQARNGASACSDDCSDAFFATLNSSGSALLFSTYVGGSDAEDVTGIALDTAGNLYAAGTTSSTNFPTVNAMRASLQGGGDGFVVKIADVLSPPTTPTKPAAHGIVNGASFTPGSAIAAGSIASVFGTDLAHDTDSATQVPLPTVLGVTTTQVQNTAAPLFYASPSQMNMQIPWEAAGTGQASVIVSVGSDTSAPLTFPLARFSPGLFSADSSGAGQGAILIANTASLVAPPGSFPDSRPAEAGEYISIFCTGLGPILSQPPTGMPAFEASSTTTLPSVSVGGVSANVVYSGLAPGYVGLYQVNVQVPFGVPPGNAVSVGLSIGGISSNTVTIAIR